MNYKLMLTITFLFTTTSITFAQLKHEKEERINREILPKTVKELLPLIENTAKGIRFYQETDGPKKSFEIKFKRHTTKYSIEFDDNGTLEDVEVLVRQSNVSQPTLRIIENHLRNDFIRFKLKRIQEHFSYPNGFTPVQTIQKIFNGTLDITGYEIVVSGKTKRGHERYEFLFDHRGNQIKKRKILVRGYDHIMF